MTALRGRIGDAAVVITGVAPLACFPALPWPLRTILNWRSAALQEAADGLADRLPRLVVERFSEPFGPHLFAADGFHPNPQAHALWGEEIATLAMPLLAHRHGRRGAVPIQDQLAEVSTDSRSGRRLSAGLERRLGMLAPLADNSTAAARSISPA